MNRLGTVVAATAIAAIPIAPTAAAASPSHCDAYSRHCTQPKSQSRTGPPVLGVHYTHPSTLPFTGADVALMSVVGIGALGAGVGFITVGRRRRSAS